MTGLPWRSSRSLGRPIRRERPAASTIAAVTLAPQRKGPAESLRGARAVRVPSLLGCCLDGPLAEYLEEMLFVLHGTLEIRLHVDAVGPLLRRGLDRRRVRRLAGDGALDPLGPDGLGPGARDADARLADVAAIHGEHSRYPDHREAGGGMGELHVRALHVGRGGRHADFRENLVICERGREEALEEVISLDRA